MDFARRTSGRKPHNPLRRDPMMRPDELAKMPGKPTVDEIRSVERENRRREFADEQARINDAVKSRSIKEALMTVSLYKSTAGGSREIVVQTNAQSLDVFITGLAEALDAAVSAEPSMAAQTISATLKNAFPVAFAIAGYKADKVSESKLLTCGFASPDASELVAQSKV